MAVKNKDLSLHRQIEASSSKVYTLLSELDELQRWWGNPVEGDPTEGGELTFRFSDSDDYAVMRVDTSEPGSEVRWTVTDDTGYDGDWIGTSIYFDLDEGNTGSSTLTFTHIGLTPDRKSYNDCKEGWTKYIDNIVRLAES